MSKVAVLGSGHVWYIYNLHLATIKHLTIHVCVGNMIYISSHGSYEISKYQSILSSVPRGKIIGGNEVKGVHLAEFCREKHPTKIHGWNVKITCH